MSSAFANVSVAFYSSVAKASTSRQNPVPIHATLALGNAWAVRPAGNRRCNPIFWDYTCRSNYSHTSKLFYLPLKRRHLLATTTQRIMQECLCSGQQTSKFIHSSGCPPRCKPAVNILPVRNDTSKWARSSPVRSPQFKDRKSNRHGSTTQQQQKQARRYGVNHPYDAYDFSFIVQIAHSC